jgi:hypothetical protein
MRKVIAVTLIYMLASSSVVLAGETDGPLVTAAAREATRVVTAPNPFGQTPAEPLPPEEKRWMERHPVWFGLIAGATAGATLGALSCLRGCYLGVSGSAMVGSWWGAGPGALIGWSVGRAD